MGQQRVEVVVGGCTWRIRAVEPASIPFCTSDNRRRMLSIGTSARRMTERPITMQATAVATAMRAVFVDHVAAWRDLVAGLDHESGEGDEAERPQDRSSSRRRRSEPTGAPRPPRPDSRAAHRFDDANPSFRRRRDEDFDGVGIAIGIDCVDVVGESLRATTRPRWWIRYASTRNSSAVSRYGLPVTGHRRRA